MPTDGPMTVGYVLGAIGTGCLFVLPLLIAYYLDSDNHRRRMARVRAMTKRERAR